jgi:integrase/recombinase XerC
MPDVIKQFEDWLRNDQGRGELTIKAYRADVCGFVKWWQQTYGNHRFDLVAVTPTDIRDYRSRLTKVDHQKTSSVNRRLAALRTFYKWAMLHDMVRRSPLAGLKMDRQQKAAPRWLEPRAEYYLQQAMEQRVQLLPPDEMLTPTDRLIVRDTALIALMWKAGLRVSEVAALDVVDLKIQSSQRGVVIIRLGKGRKYREVPLNAGTIATLRYWLKIRPISDRESALFTSKTGRRLAPRAIQAAVDQIGRVAASKVPARGSEEREIIDALNALSPHVLRHSCGKRLLDAGAQLTEVAEILGHEDLNVTRRYTQPSAVDLQRAANRI